MSTNETDYISHDEAKRVNNPTMEQRGFMRVAEDTAPYQLYPRDASLDPQLVWKGKDEQDQQNLAVPTVPIYIQEKIMPSALIDDLRRQWPVTSGEGPVDEGQLDLFAHTFNGYELEEGQDKFELETDFYSHEKNWSNRMILGDSLLVMNSLAEKEGLKGKVQCIYLDPPYGIKFGSNWQVSTRKRDVKDGKAEDAAREPEVVRAFRDTWKLGIHSYLAYLRDRLVVARELLTETGSCFVQIGDENVHLVRCLMDEVFGAENFVSLISFKTTSSLGGDTLGKSCHYIVWYATSLEQVKYRELLKTKGIEDDLGERYRRIEFPDGRRANLSEDPSRTDGRIYRHDNLTSQGTGETTRFPFEFEGKTFTPGAGQWKTHREGMKRLALARRLGAPTSRSLAYVRFIDDFPFSTFSNVWTDTQTGAFTDEKVYVVQTGVKVVERCILMSTDPGDLVLDPTCGSGTTAYVAEQWGRRWITCDTSRVALALARTRLMSARYPSYLLADSPEGVKKESELSGITPPKTEFKRDIREGFVYKRVPHVTLKSIANNPEIEPIAARLDPLIARCVEVINETTPLTWQVGTVPITDDEIQDHTASRIDWAPGQPRVDHLQSVEDLDDELEQTEVKNRGYVAFSRYWKLVDLRRALIDKAIAKHADVETLYDQPYEDKKRIRVAGPFTVESLSPHRVLAADEEQPASQSEAQRDDAANDFVTMVIENLRKAGVQNTKKGERLKFDDLAPYAGTWLQAAGTYSTADGETKRVAVSVGPEYGAVSPMQVKQAAIEARKGLGFDVLVLCGYAFDPHVGEESKDYGALTVLPARMNADLLMADDLLKKTGAGNLFMVFGEPDITVTYQEDSQVVVTLGGLDVFDPTTGEIRSNTVEDIACWFIDTNYNGESFFVRHAYFTGGNEPYEKLKKALKAEIDEGAWSSLYSNVSRPFVKPETGKFAVKVINHYGDEVLKVYEVGESRGA